MKPSTFAVLIVGAGLATVSASPLRIAIVSSHVESFGNLPVIPPAGSIPVPQLWSGHRSNEGEITWQQVHDHHPNKAVDNTDFTVTRVGRPCAHGAMREKAIEISNNLRKMFGFTPIEVNHPDRPLRLYGEVPAIHAIPVEHGNAEHHHKHHRGSTRRLMDAFMALKWWEGGAIAFVFGCGIGVLLRLVWVIAVISYRVGFRGESVDDVYEEEHDSEETVSLMAPPHYSETVSKKDSFLEEKATADA